MIKWESIGQQMPQSASQDLEKGEVQFKQFLKLQDIKFQTALYVAVLSGKENTPKCPSLDEILS